MLPSTRAVASSSIFSSAVMSPMTVPATVTIRPWVTALTRPCEAIATDPPPSIVPLTCPFTTISC